MLVDFCHWSMKPGVTSSCVSSEGHDVENLVSKDFVQKNKGFLAERFLKPPVSITFAFPCSINIHQVIVNPVVGQQKSSIIEVLTNSQKLTSSWLLGLDSARQNQIPFQLTQLTPLCVGRTDMKDPAVVCFFSPSFHAASPYCVDDFDLNRFRHVVEMKHTYGTTLVSHLTVRIIKTYESLIPGIKSVAVFGQPSQKYSKEIHEKVFHHYINSLNVKQLPTLSNNCDTSVQDCTLSEEISTSKFEVPEEFVDPITCDVMALPTLLPCGKSIDHHTLERYLENEATYGRLPNDPFTGVTFNSELYPVPNNSLKVRIDQFLLKHCDEDQVRSAPRTVGRKEDQSSFTNIKLNSSQSGETSAKISSHISIMKRKKKSLDVSEQRVKVMRVDKFNKSGTTTDSQDNLPAHSNSHGSNQNIVSSINIKEHSVPSHECRLDSSLDDAMSILQHLPSFTNTTSSTSESPRTRQGKVCVNCESQISDSALYQLACGHYICRICLTARPSGQAGNNIVKCCQCKCECSRNDVCRIFQWNLDMWNY